MSSDLANVGVTPRGYAAVALDATVIPVINKACSGSPEPMLVIGKSGPHH